ncbi:hypothetical protein OHB56_31475 [Streptomyces sp. NBC_01635]|uniref:hypothetical protein n=1 Tax=Streptomyces sp. NBC_01635 TaxID=2975904 RepID=UPI00386BA46C|nr:hypothetical protein OHB56_31475 [Streptomyces sp. NBC_01635]
MPLGGGLEWLKARDPGLRAVRRSVRVTLVACAGFYAARYGLGNHVAAIYALFGAIATGGMSFVPGTPRERARTLLAALPVAAALVTLGTVLAVHSWTAALGMLGVGFLVSFAGVGAPRIGGWQAVSRRSTSWRAFRRTSPRRWGRAWPGWRPGWC